MTEDTTKCIRCDEPVDTSKLANYVSLTFDHERGCLPIHHDCFDEVRARDLW